MKRPMYRILSAAACFAVTLVLGTLAHAADAPHAPGDRRADAARSAVAAHHATVRPATEPLSFTIDNPARISFDLPNTELALPSRRIEVKAAGLDTILAAPGKDRTRLVLNLDRLVPYETRLDGNNIVVTLGSPAVASAANANLARAAAPSTQSSSAPASNVRAVRNIDFRRGADVPVASSCASRIPARRSTQRQLGNQIVVDLAGAELPDKFMRRFDATDFGTPVSSFDVVRAGNDTRILINATGDFEHLAYQSDDQYVVEVSPRRKTQVAQDEKPTYVGERLTLNFQDIETRAVLQLLADASGQNIVVSDSVSGNVTLRPAERAVGSGAGHRAEDQGSRPAQAGQRDHRGAGRRAGFTREGGARRSQGHPGARPLRSEFVQVNYAKAQDMAELIKSQGGSLLSRVRRRRRRAHEHAAAAGHADRLADIRRLVRRSTFRFARC
jgi:type IV pilus assembly protein PilQ